MEEITEEVEDSLQSSSSEVSKAFQKQLKTLRLHKQVQIQDSINTINTINTNSINKHPANASNNNNNKELIPSEVMRGMQDIKPIVIVNTKEQQQQEINNKTNVEVVTVEEINILIDKHASTGYNQLLKGDMKQAVFNLRKADALIMAFVSQQQQLQQQNQQMQQQQQQQQQQSFEDIRQLDIPLIYFIKINLGIAYYKSELLNESFNLFFTAILAIEKSTQYLNTSNINNYSYSNVNNYTKISQKTLKELQIRLYSQMCIILSEQSDHERALVFAKKAIKAVISLAVDQAYELFQKHIFITTQNKSSNGIGVQNKSNQRNTLYNYDCQDMNEDDDYYGFHLQSSNSNKINNNSNIKYSNAKTDYDNKLTLSSQESNRQIDQPRSEGRIRSIDVDLSDISINNSNNDNSFTAKSIKGRSPRTLLTPTHFTKAKAKSKLHFQSEHSQETEIAYSDSQEQSSNPFQQQELQSLTSEEKSVLMLYKSLLQKLKDMGELIDQKEKLFLITKSTLPYFDYLNIQNVLKSAESLLSKTNILSQLQLKPIQLLYFREQSQYQLQQSLSDQFTMLISQCSVCFYCLSTESRFIEQSQLKSNNNNLNNINIENNNSILDSENYLSRALETAFTYLPHQLPLVGQIMSVHTKFHAAFKQSILEDIPDTKNNVLLRPLPGGNKSSFFIPLIRKKPEKDSQEQDNNNNNSIKDQNSNNDLKQKIQKEQQFSDTPIYTSETIAKENAHANKQQTPQTQNIRINKLISFKNQDSGLNNGSNCVHIFPQSARASLSNSINNSSARQELCNSMEDQKNQIENQDININLPQMHQNNNDQCIFPRKKRKIQIQLDSILSSSLQSQQSKTIDVNKMASTHKEQPVLQSSSLPKRQYITLDPSLVGKNRQIGSAQQEQITFSSNINNNSNAFNFANISNKKKIIILKGIGNHNQQRNTGTASPTSATNRIEQTTSIYSNATHSKRNHAMNNFICQNQLPLNVTNIEQKQQQPQLNAMNATATTNSQLPPKANNNINKKNRIELSVSNNINLFIPNNNNNNTSNLLSISPTPSSQDSSRPLSKVLIRKRQNTFNINQERSNSISNPRYIDKQNTNSMNHNNSSKHQVVFLSAQNSPNNSFTSLNTKNKTNFYMNNISNTVTINNSNNNGILKDDLHILNAHF